MLSEVNAGDNEGIEILEKIAKTDNKTSLTFFIAILNLAINTSHYEKAINYLDIITNATESKNINRKELQELQTLSYFFKSNIYEKQLKFIEAITENEMALSLSETEVKPIILWNKINLLKISHEDTENIKLEFANFIVEERLNFTDQKYYPISFNRSNLPIIFNDLISGDFIAFDNLYNYISSNLLKGEKECLDLLIQHDNNIPELCKHILINKKHSLDFSHRIAIYRILSLDTSAEKDNFNFKLYMDEVLINRENYKLTEVDYTHILSKIMSLLQKQKFQDVLTHSESSLTLFTDLNDNLSNHLTVIIRYARFIAEVQLNLKTKAIESANNLLINLNLIKEFIPEIMDATLAEGIRAQATNIPFVKNNKIINPNNNQLTLRNQIVTAKYNSGKVVKNKFKHIEKDLLDGKCIIID
ncbi:hypothetical protein [Chryseobacterium joostei]|uniref:hypothetical protein n=1 Tax=Chryseobacterium joostei TaxID=112234 RepID=UPI003D0C221E